MMIQTILLIMLVLLIMMISEKTASENRRNQTVARLKSARSA